MIYYSPATLALGYQKDSIDDYIAEAASLLDDCNEEDFDMDDDDLKILLKSRTLTVKNITFNSWEDVGRFYIDINEGITHSKSDIQKCKDWFLESKGIVL